MKPLAARAMRASLDGSEHRGTHPLRLIIQRSEENSIGTFGESSIGIDKCPLRRSKAERPVGQRSINPSPNR
jgi:hypothetical protein